MIRNYIQQENITHERDKMSQMLNQFYFQKQNNETVEINLTSTSDPKSQKTSQIEHEIEDQFEELGIVGNQSEASGKASSSHKFDNGLNKILTNLNQPIYTQVMPVVNLDP